MRYVLIALLVVFTVGCEDKGPTAPTESKVDISGSWYESGGSFVMNVVQSGTSVQGTWSIAQTNSGIVSGFSTGRSVDLTFQPASPRDCPMSLTGSVSGDGKRIDGTVALFNCLASGGGPTTLYKR